MMKLANPLDVPNVPQTPPLLLNLKTVLAISPTAILSLSIPLKMLTVTPAPKATGLKVSLLSHVSSVRLRAAPLVGPLTLRMSTVPPANSFESWFKQKRVSSVTTCSQPSVKKLTLKTAQFVTPALTGSVGTQLQRTVSNVRLTTASHASFKSCKVLCILNTSAVRYAMKDLSRMIDTGTTMIPCSDKKFVLP